MVQGADISAETLTGERLLANRCIGRAKLGPKRDTVAARIRYLEVHTQGMKRTARLEVLSWPRQELVTFTLGLRCGRK